MENLVKIAFDTMYSAKAFADMVADDPRSNLVRKCIQVEAGDAALTMYDTFGSVSTIIHEQSTCEIDVVLINT